MSICVSDISILSHLAAPMTRSWSCLPGIHQSGRSRAGSARVSRRSCSPSSPTTSSRSFVRNSTLSSTLRAFSSDTASTEPDTSSATQKVEWDSRLVCGRLVGWVAT